MAAAAAYAGAVAYPPARGDGWTEEEDAVFGQMFYFLRYIRFQECNGQLMEGEEDEVWRLVTGATAERRLLLEVFALRGTLALFPGFRATPAPLLEVCPIAGVRSATDLADLALRLMQRCSAVARGEPCAVPM